MAVLALAAAMPVYMSGETGQQDRKELQKERKALRKESKKVLSEKATKEARKEAKKLAKEGWEAAPGALPMDKQLDRSYLMQMEMNQDLTPRYIMAEGMSVGGNYDGAKMQALELAKQNLASQLQTDLNTLIESSVANDQLTAEEAVSVSKTIAASKNFISQKLGRVFPVVELYKTLSNKNKQVLVRIAYSAELAQQAIMQVMQKNLGDEAADLHKKLEAIMAQPAPTE